MVEHAMLPLPIGISDFRRASCKVWGCFQRESGEGAADRGSIPAGELRNEKELRLLIQKDLQLFSCL